jgi:hypothetical protein
MSKRIADVTFVVYEEDGAWFVIARRGRLDIETPTLSGPTPYSAMLSAEIAVRKLGFK